ncbi:unnamed protein product [Durusdinium trenchii]|uniref:Uncharacterized protein n=1 Tax=Durusdinium trenchii TaxID=1381693 RepID=A0ABP0MCQ3_9DINO
MFNGSSEETCPTWHTVHGLAGAMEVYEHLFKRSLASCKLFWCERWTKKSLLRFHTYAVCILNGSKCPSCCDSQRWSDVCILLWGVAGPARRSTNAEVSLRSL